MADLLRPEEIREALADLPGWELDGKTIRRKLRFADFPAAIAFVNRVAEAAEAADHHPDVLIHYREVTLVLWTHTQGGITRKDLALAATISRLVDGASGANA
jgi:4a-hydroxytetrahydrobiopterin dehydratase